jgi:hypothetical protein
MILAASFAMAGCALRQQAVAVSSEPKPVASVAKHKSTGWYLMQPPMRRGETETNAPLANWQVLAFFDRASECDAAREQGLKAYSSYLPVAASGPINYVRTSQRLASSTRCVAADDPRINWFHIQWK